MKLYSVHCLNIHIFLQNIMNVLDPIKSVQLKLRIYKQFCNKPLYLKTLCKDKFKHLLYWMENLLIIAQLYSTLQVRYNQRI